MSYYADSNGVKIYYQVRGEGDPLVLIMGFGADGNLWEQHVKEYEKHFKCLLIDNRGVGNSDQPPGPYSTDLMAEDTLAVMKHAGVEKARVAGISMGGAIAQQLALNYPEKVHSLALISTWPRFNNYAITVYENLKKLRVTSKPDEFMELLQLWIFAPPYYEDHLEDLKAAQVSALNNPNPQTSSGFNGQLDACINHNVVERLHEIRLPTLITVGEMDIFTPPEFSKILHQGIEGSIYVNFPEGGHVHHWEDLERFNKVSSTFFLQN
ncbi:MAG: lipolytic protein [Cyclobacteriaceae bacterium]|nr:MAG: lipolytic protein [Cyclobacteriaceae bacterium]